MKKFSKLLSILLCLSMILGMFPVLAQAATVSKKYTFSNFTAGTQYAKNEEHILDEMTTVTTTDCHFTTQLRIYSSDTYNGYAIIKFAQPITKISLNLGHKEDTLVVYGSTNGTSWTELDSIKVTATTYKDYDFTMPSGSAYTYLKLDVKGSNQIRVASMTIYYEGDSSTTTPDPEPTPNPEPTPDPEPNPDSSSTTVTVKISEYAQSNNWADGTKYTSIKMDDNVTVTATIGDYNGTYNANNNQWRIYQTDAGEISISVSAGYSISSVKITYSVNNSGTLTYNGANVSSGTTITVNASSATFGVGNTGDKTNGQARITQIEVVYEVGSAGGSGSGDSGTTTPDPEPSCAHEYESNTARICKLCREVFLTENSSLEQILDTAFALKKDEKLNINVTLTGEIETIAEPYSTQYKNVTVDFVVNGKTIKAFRMKGDGADKIQVGDTITVTGVIMNYNGIIEFDSGCTLDAYTSPCSHSEKIVDKKPASCTEPGYTGDTVCELCNLPIATGEVIPPTHNFENGACTICQEKAPITLSFASKDQRTEWNENKQVWAQNGIIVTNEKSDTSSAIIDAAAPARFYKNSKLSIEYPGMTKITFYCASASYASALSGAFGDNAKVYGAVVILTFDTPQPSIVIEALPAQVRLDSIAVTVCAHTETKIEGAADASCTIPGHTGKTVCKACGHVVSEGSPIPAGHSFTNYTSNNDATCTEDGTKTATCDREGCNVKNTITDEGSKGTNASHSCDVCNPPATEPEGGEGDGNEGGNTGNEGGNTGGTPGTPEPEQPAPETPVEPEQPAPETPVEPEQPAPETPVEPEQPAPETPVEPEQPAPETPVEPEQPAPETPVEPEQPEVEIDPVETIVSVGTAVAKGAEFFVDNAENIVDGIELVVDTADHILDVTLNIINFLQSVLNAVDNVLQ